jgi:hypothetical protein
MFQCQTRQTADFGRLLKAVYHSLYMSYPVSQLLLPSDASLVKINSLAHSEKMFKITSQHRVFANLEITTKTPDKTIAAKSLARVAILADRHFQGCSSPGTGSTVLQVTWGPRHCVRQTF